MDRKHQARRPGGGSGRGRAERVTRSGQGDLAILYGWHPVFEALNNPRRVVRRLLATENAARRLIKEAAANAIAPEIVRIDAISRLLEPDTVHQGLYLEADPLEPVGIEDLSVEALVLALDQVTDPHNVGAITRTAAAFKVDAILTTARHSPGATGVLAKAASGGLEHVPFITVANLGNALLAFRERGFRILGLDSDGDVPLDAVEPARGSVIILGAEDRGLRHRTRECCDVVARLDTPGAIRSLNVSNAAAIALFALTRASARS